MEDRHTISEPRIKSPDSLVWLVDIYRHGVDEPVDTIEISEANLPPRKRKGKVVWRLPSDHSRLPSFPVDERRRILELFKERKKNRRKERKAVGTGVDVTTTSTAETSTLGTVATRTSTATTTDRMAGTVVVDTSSTNSSICSGASGKENSNQERHGHDDEQEVMQMQKNHQPMKVSVDHSNVVRPVMTTHNVDESSKNNSSSSSNNNKKKKKRLMGRNLLQENEPNDSCANKDKDDEHIHQQPQQSQQLQPQGETNQHYEKIDMNTISCTTTTVSSSTEIDGMASPPSSRPIAKPPRSFHDSTFHEQNDDTCILSSPPPPGFLTSMSELTIQQQEVNTTEPMHYPIHHEYDRLHQNMPSHPHLYIVIPEIDRPPMPPTSSIHHHHHPSRPSVAIPAAKAFVDLYYRQLTLGNYTDLCRYYTSNAQKSISVGGAHSVVATRSDIMLQLQSLSQSLFVVRGVVSQDTHDGKGAHILVTGVVQTGEVVSQFAHSVGLVAAPHHGDFSFQIHNDALSLLTSGDEVMCHPEGSGIRSGDRDGSGGEAVHTSRYEDAAPTNGHSSKSWMQQDTNSTFSSPPGLY